MIGEKHFSGRTTHRACAVLLAVVFTLLQGIGAKADLKSAQFSITQPEIQKSPAFFKFQSRVSQGKIPLGDVKFPQILVYILNGTNAVCSETFKDVQVSDSVLNLEIGRGTGGTCDMDSLVAKYNDLQFKVCLNGAENCLKPISFATVPYAVKASYAYTANKALNANEAVQCHYAHRVTADREMFVTQKVGKGYFDFYTPTDTYFSNSTNLKDMFWYDQTGQSIPSSKNGGYVQWAGVDPNGNNLHICATAVSDPNNTPIPLDELVLHADFSRFAGQLIVEGPANKMDRGAKIKQGMEVSGVTQFLGDNIATLENQHVVVGLSKDTYRMVIWDKLDVQGSTDFYGNVTVNAAALTTINGTAVLNGTATHNGASSFNNTAVFNRPVTVAAAATTTMNAPATFNGLVNCTQNVTLAASSNFTVGGTTNLNGKSNLNGDVTLGINGGNNSHHIYGTTVFHGNVTIPSDGLGYTIPANSITSSQIAEGAITSREIFNGTISSVDLSTGAVTSTSILNGTITADDLALGSVTSTSILNGTIKTEDLATGAVTSTIILNGTITADDLATGSVTSTGILNGTVTADDLATGSVTSTGILNGTITVDDLATGAVTSAKIFDGTISAADLGPNACGTAQIATGAVTNAKLGPDAVTADKIKNYAVQKEHLSLKNGTASTYTADKYLGNYGLCVLSGSIVSPTSTATYAGCQLEYFNGSSGPPMVLGGWTLKVYSAFCSVYCL